MIKLPTILRYKPNLINYISEITNKEHGKLLVFRALT